MTHAARALPRTLVVLVAMHVFQCVFLYAPSHVQERRQVLTQGLGRHDAPLCNEQISTFGTINQTCGTEILLWLERTQIQFFTRLY